MPATSPRGNTPTKLALSRWRVRRAPAPGMAAILLGLSAWLFVVQSETPTAEAAQPPARAENPDRPAKPVDVSGTELMTSDGVQLRATFFPGEEDQETVPVILLHSWKADRREYIHLAPFLQKKGYSVLVPDLRGHGLSTQQVAGFGARRQTRELDAAKFRGPEFAAMARYDMAALRRFLLKKNNDKELNLNKLVVVGSEMGASVAIAWAVHDWSIPNYPHAGIKQGQDVKGLVLLSPKWSQPGINVSAALNGPIVGVRLQLMIAVGKQDSKCYRDARQFDSKMKSMRPGNKDLPLNESSFWYFPLETDRQGAEILAVPSLKLHDHIAAFIQLRVVRAEGENAPWMEHKAP